MKYDFETIINRSNTGSFKWEQMKSWKPDVRDGIVPFSVADMEFKMAPEIIEGLKGYLDTATLGYAMPTESYYNAVCGWMKKRHNWDIKPEWITGSAGVVRAFFAAVRSFTDPGNGVIIMTPVYYPFYNAISRNNRKLVNSPLINTGSTYIIDYDDLEKKAKDPNNKVLLFCSPHNPVGRVWRRDELERVGEICLRNNVLIISDEIHFDLVMPGNKHTVFAAVSQELADNLIVCTAPSKTFNLAGMHNSNIIIPNSKLREKYLKENMSIGFSSLNILGYKACEIAYEKCEAWLDGLLKVIDHNRLELKKYIEENIPEIKVYDLEGTYLQWMDFNAFHLDKDELERLMHEKAEVFFDEGYVFGEEGNGFERMNIACPTTVMLQALDRLKQTLRR